MTLLVLYSSANTETLHCSMLLWWCWFGDLPAKNMQKNKGTQGAPKMDCKHNCDKAVLRQFHFISYFITQKIQEQQHKNSEQGTAGGSTRQYNNCVYYLTAFNRQTFPMVYTKSGKQFKYTPLSLSIYLSLSPCHQTHKNITPAKHLPTR